VSQPQEEQQRQELQKELDRLEKQIQDLKERQKDGFQDVETQKQIKDDLIKVVEKLDVKTEKNGAVFHDNATIWSFNAEKNQIQQGNLSYKYAKEFCELPENSHCKTIGDTEGGKWLEKQDIYNDCLKKNDADEVWFGLSAKMAQEAKGEAHSFVEIKSAEQRTWEIAEKPALRNNEEVTGINYHYHQTPDQEIVKRENLARPERVFESKEFTIDRISDNQIRVNLPNGETATANLTQKEFQDKLGISLQGKSFREDFAKKLSETESGKTLEVQKDQKQKSGIIDPLSIQVDTTQTANQTIKKTQSY
jgi:hypothetical protein